MIRFSVDSAWASLEILMRFQMPTSFVFHVNLVLLICINPILECLILFLVVEIYVEIFP